MERVNSDHKKKEVVGEKERGSMLLKKYQSPKISELGSLTKVTLGGTGGIVADTGGGSNYRYNP